MDTEIMVEAHAILGVCNLCLNEGAVKSMLVPHINVGKLEIYSQMLLNCFSIDISQIELGDTKRLICFSCIDNLRECETFRTMVQQSLNTLKENVKLLNEGKVANIKEEVDNVDIKDNDLDDIIHKNVDFDEYAEEKVAIIKEEVDTIDIEDSDLDDVIHKDDDFDENDKVANIKEEIDDIDIEDIDLDDIMHKNDDFDENELRPFMAKWNAEVVLLYSTVYPFRIKANTLICVYCREEYEDPDSYRQHIDDVHPTFNVATAFSHLRSSKQYLKVDCTYLKCRICYEPIMSIEDMAKHLKELHENSQTRNINLDFDVGLQPYRLEHNKWNCVICEKKMASLTKLCRHTPSHYKHYTCDQCGRGYLTKWALKCHVKCQHMGKFVCRKCWKDFPSDEQKRSHIRSSKRCWWFCCTICQERFLFLDQKNKHLIDFHGRKKTTYSCPDCTKVFDSRGNFYSHYKLGHTNLKFNTKNRLEEHRITHTGEKKYKCQVCSKNFKTNKDLAQHMWIHSEMKRFICMICDKQFVQKVNLEWHFKSTHPNVKIKF